MKQTAPVICTGFQPSRRHCSYMLATFLGEFAKLRKATISFVMNV